MEVWNKVDLITDEHEEAFKEKVEEASKTAEFPIVLMSCSTGFNKDLFMSELGNLAAEVLGKQLVSLSYQSWEHAERVKWLVNTA
jgi:50S ribosomal subunit-associated GTPase HflX